MPEPLSITIDDDTETVRVDPVTGTVETDQPDGGVVVQLDAHKPRKDEDDEDPWFGNLVDEVDATKLGIIANELIDAIDADDRSRAGYLATRARGLDLLGIKLESPGAAVGDSASGVEGMSKVTNPLLLEALLKGWANAQAEMLPADGPMKVAVRGNETEQQDELADALERDFNHYLTKTAPEYYPETSHMLLWGTYFGGSGFKKVYRCPMRRRPVSESIDVKDLIVSDTTKDLRACGRITHEILMRPSVMRRMQLIGAYRDVGLTQPTPAPNVVQEKIAGIQGTQAAPSRPEDQPYNLYETQCELDLDEFVPAGSQFKGERIPLPYLVTLDKDSREVLALRRDWDEDDEQCDRRRMYVKYPYVPGPGFYGTGLINILGNASAAMTAAWREALDAGMFASFPAGLIAKLGGRQNSVNFRLAPGEFPAVETNGMPINQIVMGLPYRDVTPGLMSMIDKIVAQAQGLGGVADIPTAEGIQNVPVGTMLAQIEQATKVVAAAHKGMHQAQSEEFDLIINLFRENPEDFWRANKVCPPNYWDEQKFLAALNERNLTPKSDPNVPSHLHRVMKALALVQLIGIPVFTPLMNPKETLLRCLRVIREDPQGLVVDPAPQQGPPDLLGQAKMMEAQVKGAKVQSDAATAAGKQDVERQDIASRERIAGLDLQGEVIAHAHDADKARFTNTLAARTQAHEEACGADEAAERRAGAVHDRLMDITGHQLAERQHALDVYEVMHPPKPAKPAKPKSKS